MKKKILILGPIGDFGGREIETGFIASSLSSVGNVKVLSTVNCTSTSQIFDFIDKKDFIALNLLIYKQYFHLRALAYLNYFKSWFKKQPYFYVSNSISKKYGFQKYAVKALFEVLNDYDLIFICAQLSSKYVREVVEYASKNKIPILFRTSNTIKETDVKYKNWFGEISMFIHHSINNANRFDFIKKVEFSIIDQCCINEKKLLRISPTVSFGKLLFIGRLSEEKGILELVNFCSKNTSISLDIIGDGSLMKKLKIITSQFDNIKLLGFKKQNEIINYIKQSDAIVIPSHEESGPLTGLEAMAAGRIILSTKVGAMEERLKGLKNQFWFSIDDYNSFENLICKLQKLEKYELSEIATENRMRYSQDFCKHIIEREYTKLVSFFLKI